jgi:hypothetical protein
MLNIIWAIIAGLVSGLLAKVEASLRSSRRGRVSGPGLFLSSSDAGSLGSNRAATATEPAG